MKKHALTLALVVASTAATAQVSTPRQAFLEFQNYFEARISVTFNGQNYDILNEVTVSSFEPTDFSYCLPSIRSSVLGEDDVAEYTINFTRMTYDDVNELWGSFGDTTYRASANPVHFAFFPSNAVLDARHAGTFFQNVQNGSTRYLLYAGDSPSPFAGIVVPVASYIAACQGVTP